MGQTKDRMEISIINDLTRFYISVFHGLHLTVTYKVR